MVTGPVAHPGPGEVRVAVHATGLAPSDHALYEGTRASELVRYPVTPGHEWSGTVEAVGEGVDPALLGRRTVGEGLRVCQMCESCRQDLPLCCVRGYAETGFTEPGACAEVLITPARLLHPLDDGADLIAATLLEPAAHVAGAVLTGHPLPGSRVAVVGADTRGLLAVQLLAAFSPAALHVVDCRPGRAERALPMGASSAHTPSDAVALRGRCDLVLVMSGSGCVLNEVALLARPGGQLVLCGEFEPDGQSLEAALLTERQFAVRAVTGPSARSWSYAVRAFRAGLLKLRSLVTDELPLEDFARAMALLETGGGEDGCRVVLRP